MDFADNTALWLAGLIVAGALAGFALLWGKVTAFTEKHAAPLRAKPEADRTLTDKLIIEADRRADLLNIEQYEAFLESYVAAYLVDILRKAPIVGPMEVAAERVDDMIESLGRRNPDLAARLDQSLQTAKEKLAGAIGKAMQKQGINVSVEESWVAPRIPGVTYSVTALSSDEDRASASGRLRVTTETDPLNRS